jgi:hypothetical protein
MSKLRFLEVTDFKVMRECGSDCFKERLGWYNLLKSSICILVPCRISLEFQLIYLYILEVFCFYFWWY